MTYIKLFLKFGSKENILDLYNNGTIYMNTIQYFRQIEDQELRGDKYEGVSKIINSLSGTIKIKGIEREFNYISAHMRESHEVVLGNIYSLYGLSSRGFPTPNDFKFDERNLRFGTHALMIKDLPYFLRVIKSELKKQKLIFHQGFVDYYDKDKYSGEVSLFQKPLEFEYQKEFRFYVKNNDLTPIKIQIGSLDRCAEIINAKDMTALKLIANLK